MYPVFLFLFGFIKYKINEIKIVMYKTVHTGKKTPLGGDKKGLIKELYQSELYIILFYFFFLLYKLPESVNFGIKCGYEQMQKLFARNR